MKYLPLYLVTLFLLGSCSDARIISEPRIVNSSKEQLLSNTVLFDDLDEMDLMTLYNENDNTIVLNLAKTEFLTNVWNDIVEKADEVEDRLYDELNLLSVTSRYSDVYFNPFDFDEGWLPFLNEVQYVYTSEDGASELTIGQHIVHKDSTKKETKLVAFDTNLANDIFAKPGYIALKFIFNEKPDREIKILFCKNWFRFEYEYVYYY